MPNCMPHSLPTSALTAAPAAPQHQQCLPLEPSAAELLAEVQRLWLASAFWRRRFKSLDELLADPQRRHVLTVCARQLWRQRMQRQARRPR